MSDKTKRYWWLPWAVVVAVVMGIAVLGSYTTNWYFLAPWSPAAGLITKTAINEFSAGIVDTAPYWSLRLTALASIVLTFVVGPSLWIYAELSNQSKRSLDALKKGAVWYVGVFLVVASLQVVPTTIIKGIVFQNTWDSAEKSKTADELRSNLFKLGFDALEDYHLSARAGEGTPSFQRISADGEIRPIELSDLESFNRDLKHTYVLAPVQSDSVITIHGVADMDGPNSDFENINGQTGRLELAAEVHPPADIKFKQPNSSY